MALLACADEVLWTDGECGNVTIKIDGPITLTPAKEPEPEPKPGSEAVWVFIGILVIIGLLLRFW